MCVRSGEVVVVRRGIWLRMSEGLDPFLGFSALVVQEQTGGAEFVPGDTHDFCMWTTGSGQWRLGYTE